MCKCVCEGEIKKKEKTTKEKIKKNKTPKKKLKNYSSFLFLFFLSHK